MKNRHPKQQALKEILAGNVTSDQVVRKLSRTSGVFRLFHYIDGVYYPNVPGLTGDTPEQIYDYLKIHSIAHTRQQMDALDEDIIVIHAVKPKDR